MCVDRTNYQYTINKNKQKLEVKPLSILLIYGQK